MTILNLTKEQQDRLPPGGIEAMEAKCREVLSVGGLNAEFASVVTSFEAVVSGLLISTAAAEKNSERLIAFKTSLNAIANLIIHAAFQYVGGTKDIMASAISTNNALKYMDERVMEILAKEILKACSMTATATEASHVLKH